MIELDFHSWKNVNEVSPYKGQIVEVLVCTPAIYSGKNEFNCPIWDCFSGIESVLYWRFPSNPIVYPWVNQQLIERDNNNFQK